MTTAPIPAHVRGHAQSGRPRDPTRRGAAAAVHAYRTRDICARQIARSWRGRRVAAEHAASPAAGPVNQAARCAPREVRMHLHCEKTRSDATHEAGVVKQEERRQGS